MNDIRLCPKTGPLMKNASSTSSAAERKQLDNKVMQASLVFGLADAAPFNRDFWA